MSWPYIRRDEANDWTVFFRMQIGAQRMLDKYRDLEMKYMIYTTARNDGCTIMWIQMKKPVGSDTMRRWFPDADWGGATTAHEEAEAWFVGNPQEETTELTGTNRHF